MKSSTVAFIFGIINTAMICSLYVKISNVERTSNQTAVSVKELELYNNKTKIVFSSKEEFNCLAENIYYESRGEPLMGKIAVAQTVFNRAESGRWGKSFCSVVHAPYQFSWTLKDKKKPSGKDWKESVHAAKLFVDGFRIKDLEKTDHYHSKNVNPSWNEKMKSTAKIGNHLFFASR